MQASDKSRTSSGGRSGFFSRGKKDKSDRRYISEESTSRHLDVNSQERPGSHGSRTSRHTRGSSVASLDRPFTPNAESGLAMDAGVMTSISYDSVTADSKSPIPVDYLPRGDQMPLRSPLPHHLNKSTGDYHQYPSFDPASVATNGSSHPSGPRPPPGVGNITMASTGNRSTQLQQWGPARDSTGSRNHNSRYDSYSTASSAYGRSSFEGMSVDTDRTSAYSSGSSSRTTRPSTNDNDNKRTTRFPTNHMSQASIAFNQTASVAPPGFHLAKPTDERVIEEQFLELMQKRGWHNLPDQARRQMMAYPPAKKWTLVHQDRLTEWQGEQKRRTMAHKQSGPYGDAMEMLANADEEGTPEWFVKKVMDNSITAKQLQSLAVSLRTQPIGWVKTFVECQGQVALTNVLAKINRRQAQGPAPVDGTISDKDLDKEYDIVKCLKALMNNKFGADDALVHQGIIVALATSLISPRLTTRKLVSEVLTFLCHWADGQGHLKVIQALDFVKNQQAENGRFDAWMRIVEVTVDGRGKMGSLVGASEEVRSGGIGMENLLMEYAVATLFLINMMIDAPERDLQLRVHIRAQFTACGIKRILTKMEGFQYDVIDKQIERFRSNEAIDYEDMLERENSSIKDSIEGEVKDLSDPTQIVDAIMTRVQGTRTQDYFISALQHLLLIRDNESEERLRMFQLVDNMLSYVAMDRRLPDMDLKQSLNFTVQSLLDKLHTDSEARQALDEALEARQLADSALAERDEMKAQIEMGADGLVAKLQRQLEEQAQIIEIQKRQADTLKSELESLQSIRAKEAQRYELETRELYLMLRDAQDVAASQATKGGGLSDPEQMKGILDREKLMDRLEMQIERQKTQYKLEGRVWGEAAGPSDRLRALREEMDGIAGASAGGLGVPGQGTPPRGDFSNSMLGSVSRNTRIARKPVNGRRHGEEATAEHFADTDYSEDEDGTVYEKPRVVEFRRPKVPADAQAQAQAYIGDISSKVKKYDASDDEDGDGVTTGPSHPSVESGSPRTPRDDGDETVARPGKTGQTGATGGYPDGPGGPNSMPGGGYPDGPGGPNSMPGGGFPDGPGGPNSMPGGGFPNGPGGPNSMPPSASMPEGFTGEYPPSMPPSASMPEGFTGGPPPPPPPPPPPGFNGPPPPPPPPPPGGFSGGPPPPPPPPPGFGMGPPPPPPPMPGKMTPGKFLAGPQTISGPSLGLGVARPKKKLKALHWEKVDAPMTTHWAAHAPTHAEKEEKYAELSRKGVLDEVEKLFLAKEIKQIGKSGSKKVEKKQIISSDLMRTFQISLAKFSSYPVEKVVQMIIHCDGEVLDNAVVMDFLQKDDMCNIPDNAAKLLAPYSRDWTGPGAEKEKSEQDPNELTREDQIYLQTAFELHHYWKSRIRALALTRTFEAEYDDISQKLKQVVVVSESLRDSVSLMNVLGLILDIGNYMNDSNKQASGFKLSSLARLGMVKDDKNESTFADLVERIVRTQYPEWEGFVDDIHGVVTAQKLNVEQLQSDAKKYIDNIKNVQMSLDSGNLSDPKKFHPQDRVSQIVQRSMKDARRKAEQMQLYLEDMVKTYDDIMVFYGEDAADDNARRDFFAKLAIFVTEWRKSKEKNIALEETRKRNEASMKRKHAQLKVNGTVEAGPASPSSTGAMDSLLEKLRAAAPQTRDQRDRRRRARLQNRHQVRVASGQRIPEPDEIPEVEEGLMSPDSVSTDANPMSPDLLSPDMISHSSMTSMMEEPGRDDIAQRAASLLQGMRGAEGNAEDEAERRESQRRSRRRETADEERKARRRRREKAGSSSGGAGEQMDVGNDDDGDYGGGVEREKVTTPTLVVGEGSEEKPIELDE